MGLRRMFVLGVTIALCGQADGPAASEGGHKASGKEIDQIAVKGCTLEAGTLMGHHSNVLFRANDPDLVPTATTSTLYLRGCARSRLLTGYLDARATTFFSDVDVADQEAGRAGLMLTPGNTRLSVDYLFMPSNISSEEGEAAFTELRGAQVRIRQGRSRGVWFAFAYSQEQWEHDVADRARDADTRLGKFTVRFPLGGSVGLRLTYMRFDKDAIESQHNWRGDGAALTLEMHPGRRVNARLRVRLRERAYEDATALTGNFQRQDEIRDVALDLRMQAARHWGIRMQDSYVKVVSTLDDHSYDVFQANAGIYVNF
jgi:hypothetical protein